MSRTALVLALLALSLGRAPLSLGADASTLATAGNGRGAAPCNSCHGAHGEGMRAAGYPRLAGMPAAYLEEQLDEFASAGRPSTVMQPIATALSTGERRAVAMYFAGLKVSAPQARTGPAPVPDRGAAEVARGAILAATGRWSVGLPPCAACHGPEGTGVGTRFPALAGQPEVYLASELHAWQAARRAPGPLGLMRLIASKLTDADIAAIAAFYAAQPASGGPQGESLLAEELAPPRRSAAPARVPAATQASTSTLASGTAAFQPPPRGSEPGGELGQTIREGERIFLLTDQYAAPYVGNHLHCSNCHLDAGRRAASAPLWAAYVLYPAYRSKNHHVNTYEERLQGCFRFSMNGKAPPLGSPVLVALETYSYWLARGAPTGVQLQGQGYPSVAKPARPADYARGAQVYAKSCALCHGPDGAGQSSASHEVVFPALWGAGSFNWGAGMESIDKAAGFIEANMPLALSGTLTPQQAWDVALYIDSQERPQDPRFTGSVAETRSRFHDSPFSMYGRLVNGRLLGHGD